MFEKESVDILTILVRETEKSYIIYYSLHLADVVYVFFLGKLLREVEPDLMDTLINATNQGDLTRIQALIASAKEGADDAGVSDFNDLETESEDEGEVSVNQYIQYTYQLSVFLMRFAVSE